MTVLSITGCSDTAAYCKSFVFLFARMAKTVIAIESMVERIQIADT